MARSRLCLLLRLTRKSTRQAVGGAKPAGSPSFGSEPRAVAARARSPPDEAAVCRSAPGASHLNPPLRRLRPRAGRVRTPGFSPKLRGCPALGHALAGCHRLPAVTRLTPNPRGDGGRKRVFGRGSEPLWGGLCRAPPPSALRGHSENMTGGFQGARWVGDGPQRTARTWTSSLPDCGK